MFTFLSKFSTTVHPEWWWKKQKKSFVFARRLKISSPIFDTSSRSPPDSIFMFRLCVLFFSDCFPFNFNFYYNFSRPDFFLLTSSSLLSPLLRGAVHLKWLMLPKIEINKEKEEKNRQIWNFVSVFHVQRKYWCASDTRRIAGVFFSADHYNSWEVFNELIALSFCFSVACPLTPLLNFSAAFISP